MYVRICTHGILMYVRICTHGILMYVRTCTVQCTDMCIACMSTVIIGGVTGKRCLFSVKSSTLSVAEDITNLRGCPF